MYPFWGPGTRTPEFLLLGPWWAAPLSSILPKEDHTLVHPLQAETMAKQQAGYFPPGGGMFLFHSEQKVANNIENFYNQDILKIRQKNCKNKIKL